MSPSSSPLRLRLWLHRPALPALALLAGLLAGCGPRSPSDFTPFAELKNVYDAEERRRLLEGAFKIDGPAVQRQRVLLLDDLYRSGATMNVIAEAIAVAGAQSVYAFAFTQTRSRT